MKTAFNSGFDKLKLPILVGNIRKSIVEILDKPASELVGHQAFNADKKLLVLWAADCGEHVLPIFEGKYPNDDRPKKAVEACRTWAATGIFKMVVIRKVSLDSHAAARSAGKDSSAFCAARSAGQAAATTHVVTHSLGAAAYAIKAASLHSDNIEDGLVKEWDWQRQRLMEYAQKNNRWSHALWTQ